MGKNLVYLPLCQSTNAVGSELGQKPGTADGTLVITDRQTSGRGQRGNSWESQPGKNLTFSLILKPGFLSLNDQFRLNEAISVGIADYITAKVSEKVQIKWPNDILVDGKKVCGILIENHISGDLIQYAVVGIGLNVNQPFFSFPQAASLKTFTGMEYLLESELVELVGALEARYLELREGRFQSLTDRYLRLLFQKGRTNRFRAADQIFEGVITGVNGMGQLTINVGTEERCFGVKEVTLIPSTETEW